MFSKIKQWHLIVIVFLIIATLQYQASTYGDYFVSQENYLQDKLYQKGKTVDEAIKLIAIDDESLNKLGQWPWSRATHAKLIDILSKGKAAAIGIDVLFSEHSMDLNNDSSLVEAVKKAGNVVNACYGDMPKTAKVGEVKANSLVTPFDELNLAGATGHINVFSDDTDSVVRKCLNSFTYNGKQIYSFDIELCKEYAKHFGKIFDPKKVVQDGFNRSYIDYTDKAGSYTPIPYYMVLNGQYDPEFFKDSIVLIGPYTVGTGDFYKTSIDKSAQTYGIEIHANIIQNLLHGVYKKEIPFPYALAILIIFSLISYLSTRKFKPLKSSIITIGVIVTYIFVASFIYGKGYILSIFYPVILISLTYLILLAFNYLKELFERRRVTNIFGRYVAPQVVKQILSGGEEGLKLGGTRKEISVLFVDIRGFTPMSEKAQPEEVVEILNDYLDLCARSIFKFNGTLDKFIGDATMAIFNAPLDLEDHAFKAVQTAWAMKQGAEVLRISLEERFGRSVQFGIGVNTGPAVVGNIGSKTRMDYTAIGDTVNTSARLESNAKPGQILLSQTTYDLVKDKVEVTYLGEISVKGKTQGVPIYQLEGVKESDE